LAVAAFASLVLALAVGRIGLTDVTGAPQATPGDAETRQLFAERVLPLLKEKCFACHGDDVKKLRGGLDLRTRTAMLAGGKRGKPVIVPGRPEDSLLYLSVTRQNDKLAMPPKENDRLSAEQIEWVRQWIAAGAPWSETKQPPATVQKWDSTNGVTVKTTGGRSPEWTNRKYRPEDIWAYQSVRRYPVPAGAAHPIDAFLQEKRVARGVTRSAPPADKITLIRRATFDLTGLPPSPADVEVFVKDESPDAFDRLIGRLLKSPHYGEQQARHWLDVVRYADTSGFANDYERPNAWRYRDYVVRSFNTDKPFDRFIKEQLAGDELDPDDPEMAIAVGFLRMGPWEHTGMTVAALTRQHFLDDITHSIGVTFLGQGLRCASCHDHKFDPVPTKDYYRLQAVFATTQFAERPVPFLPSENIGGFAESRAVVETRLKKAKTDYEALRQKSAAAIAAYLKQRGIAQLTDLPPKDRPLRDRFGLNDLELSLIRILRKRIDYFERELLRFQPYAFSVYDGPARPYLSTTPINPVPTTRSGAAQLVRILPGGALETPAEAVTPGVLSAVADAGPSAWNTIPETIAGRRLALANWIASPTNPLTARVIVNRVWQQHFGRGLVATPNNFGKMGKRPTHPELLDWLAVWFVEHGWSLKKLHRLILTSAAYQQSGAHLDPEKLRRSDPNNELLACYPPRRLAAEEIRDAMLAVSGELNPELGGPGVFPEINWEVALQPRHIMGSVAPAYQPSPKPQQRNRRTLYAFRYRNLADPMQEVFNRPGSETSCERRDETTVTPQVFALYNGVFAHDRALALAVSLEKEARDQDGQIRIAFRRCYGRSPTAEEVDMCRSHIEKMTTFHREHPPKPVELPKKVKRKMVEEMTGEEFSWEEELDGMQGYQRDVKPWDVGAETRALADLCLVLFNSNEFLYVR
jgi:mono/diheme cytochrome c family protein